MKIKRKMIIVLLLLFICLILYLLFWPVKINPQAWIPPKAPKLEGIYKPNKYLSAIKIIGSKNITCSESLTFDNDGNIYGGTANGEIYKIDPDGNNFKIITKLEKVILGLNFDKNKNLIVIAPYQGLLSITPDGKIDILTTGLDNVKFKLLDDLIIAKDGLIYFTEASCKYEHKDFYLDIAEHAPNGKLFTYNPKTKVTKLLLDKLYFANGIAISPDEDFLLISETIKYRIIKYWIAGTKKGTSEIFIDNLPGLPDGMYSNGKGIYWVTLFTLRNKTLDYLLPKPFLRKIILRLPDFLKPGPQKHEIILGLNDKGEVIYNLQDPDGKYSIITSVKEFNNKLFFGSVIEKGIGVISVPKNTNK